MNDNQYSNTAGVLSSEIQFWFIFSFSVDITCIDYRVTAGWLELYVADFGFINP